MNGLVNRAIGDMLRGRHGANAWQRIRDRAGVGEQVFAITDSYDDDVTYCLIGAASEILAVPTDVFLEEFGMYWTSHLADYGFDDLMHSSGSSFVDFLQNLNDMHRRITVSMPDLRLPSFRCDAHGDGSLTLHYFSPREGFAPMVRGVIKGLAARFGVAVSIVHTVRTTDGADHDAFSIVPAAGESLH